MFYDDTVCANNIFWKNLSSVSFYVSMIFSLLFSIALILFVYKKIYKPNEVNNKNNFSKNFLKISSILFILCTLFAAFIDIKRSFYFGCLNILFSFLFVIIIFATIIFTIRFLAKIIVDRKNIKTHSKFFITIVGILLIVLTVKYGILNITVELKEKAEYGYCWSN